MSVCWRLGKLVKPIRDCGVPGNCFDGVAIGWMRRSRLNEVWKKNIEMRIRDYGNPIF